ncbi:MAG: hypothetical protein A4E33_02399 [Methanoregula sp. PtaB.Bin085]|nr:MAG: hypothetical protein A4E33_02399 [Methanoregula sp. PtaB.Bin085]
MYSENLKEVSFHEKTGINEKIFTDAIMMEKTDLSASILTITENEKIRSGYDRIFCIHHYRWYYSNEKRKRIQCPFLLKGLKTFS